MAGEAGKGSSRRPAQVSDDQFAKNWERAFGKKKQRKPKGGKPARPDRPAKA